MAKFFETFTVEESDGDWTNGSYPLDTFGGSFHLYTQDICSPAAPGKLPESSLGQEIFPFAVTAYAEVPPRCAPSDIEDFLRKAFIDSTEWSISHALWHGPDSSEGNMYLTHPDVEVVTAGPDPVSTVGKLLEEAYKKTPYLQPVIHLGFQVAMSLQFGLATLGIPFVVPNGYPANAIAVTGPVRIRMGSVQNLTEFDTSINRQYFEATRIAAIEFDPTQAVRSS